MYNYFHLRALCNLAQIYIVADSSEMMLYRDYESAEFGGRIQEVSASREFATPSSC